MVSATAAIFLAFVPVDPSSVMDKVQGIFDSNRNIKSLEYEFIRTERIDGEQVENMAMVKFQKKPYQIYIREVYPNEGLEVLYPHPDDETMALVNPNGFPWMNVKLDPRGDIMTKGQHHTIFEGGFDYLISVVEYIFYKYKSNIEEYVSYEGITLFDGRTCDVIVMENPNFKYINYTVSKGETIASIAKKYHLSEYMISSLNDHLGFMTELTVGDVLRVPTDYASKMKFLVDRERQIPLRLEIYDEKGIFEKYEFKNVVINPTFVHDEFLMTFSDYSFN